LGLWIGASGCAPPPQMCMFEAECGAVASCVAGRCVRHGAVAAIATARRLTYGAREVALVSRDGSVGSTPEIALLGRGDGARVLLRYEVELPPDAEVLEAYLILERCRGVDADPTPVALHAARVVQTWDSSSVSWARQPRVEEVHSPVTRVWATSGPIVRLDVRQLVELWRRRRGDELGLAVLADGSSATGVPFALRPTAASASEGRGDPLLNGRSVAPTGNDTWTSSRTLGSPAWTQGPELELYLK
jgi:hypothetical protein